MSSNDQMFLDYSMMDACLAEEEIFSQSGSLDRGESLASLLATAAIAVNFDRPLAQKCIQRAARLLGITPRVEAAQTLQRSQPQGALASWQITRIEAYVDDNLGSTIRAAQLAELLRLSTSHFHHAFRKAFGMSPIAYVMKRRMRRAQELMLNSRSSLSQVALECGMCDQAHFSRSFRRLVGSSPSVWRRQLARLASGRGATGP